MQKQIRSGKIIGYIFAVPSLITSALVYYDHRDLPLTVFFGLFACIGFLMIIYPSLLIDISEEQMIFYAGTLILNKPLLFLYLSNLESIEPVTITNDDGTDWFLKVSLVKEIELDDKVRNHLRRGPIKRISNRDTVLYWSLSWPCGGVDVVAQTLNEMVIEKHHSNARKQINPFVKSQLPTSSLTEPRVRGPVD